jgi:integrase
MNRTTTRAGAKSIDSDLSGHPLAASVLDRVPSQAQSLFLPILSMEDGRPLDPPYITRLFNRLRQQDPPLPPIRFHGLTHSYTALMISSGADIAITSKSLGHSSISITADVYGHLVGTAASDAVNRAANLLTRTSLAQQGVEA